MLSQEATSELNEKSTDDTANSNKFCKNNRQQEKLEIQIHFVRGLHYKNITNQEHTKKH